MGKSWGQAELKDIAETAESMGQKMIILQDSIENNDNSVDIDLSLDELRILPIFYSHTDANDDTFNPATTALFSILRIYGEIQEGHRTGILGADEYQESDQVSDRVYSELKQMESSISDGIIVDDAVLLLTLISEVLEELTNSLFEQELISEKHSGQNRTDTLIEAELGQKQKEELLFRCGVIGKKLHDEMAHARTRRNDMVHDMKTRHYLSSITDLTSELKRCVDVVDELSRLTGPVGFSVTTEPEYKVTLEHS